MAVIEYMNVVLGANHQKLDKDLENATRKIHSFSVNVGGLGKAIGAIGAGAGVGALVKNSVSLAAEAETAGVQFEVLTGSVEKAQKILREMRKLDQESPLAFTDFQQAAKTMMGFGISAEDVTERMKQLSAISMGNADRMQSLTLAFAQTSAAGRLMGQEVLQFVNAGFNPLQQISKMTGESMAELKKRMEDGGVSVQEVGKALDYATGKGGLFYGMNEKIAQTTAGQLAKLQGDFKLLGIEIGKGLLPALNDVVSLMREFTSTGGVSDGFLAKVSQGVGTVARFYTGGLAFMAGDSSKWDKLGADISDAEAQQKANSILHKRTPEEEERFQKRMKEIDDQRKLGEEVKGLLNGLMNYDMDAMDASSKKIAGLREEIELQKQKNAGINVEIEAKAKAMGYSKQDQERVKSMLLELEKLKNAPAKQNRAMELMQDESSIEAMIAPFVEAANLLAEGFLGKTDFELFSMRQSMKIAESQVAERRDTPTIMAGSVEAYKLFLERDQEQARQIELAEKSNQVLTDIHAELKARQLLGVVKR